MPVTACLIRIRSIELLKSAFACIGAIILAIASVRADGPSREPDCIVDSSATWKRSLFNGLAQVIVQSTGDAGEIRVTASSCGLESASVILKSETASPSPSVP
jgi:hypothetical protein